MANLCVQNMHARDLPRSRGVGDFNEFPSMLSMRTDFGKGWHLRGVNCLGEASRVKDRGDGSLA
jgi:hypothetical protein